MLREALIKMGIYPADQPADPTADKLRKLFPSCTVCGKSLEGHRYLQLAVSFRESSITELFRLLRNHEWTELSKIDEWNPEANALVVYAILGPHERGFAASIRSPHELFEAHEVYTVEELAATDVENLLGAFANGEWKPL